MVKKYLQQDQSRQALLVCQRDQGHPKKKEIFVKLISNTFREENYRMMICVNKAVF